MALMELIGIPAPKSGEWEDIQIVRRRSFK